MLYDYRTIHRSGINRSGKDRLMLQINFCRSWYRDVCNKVPGGMF